MKRQIALLLLSLIPFACSGSESDQSSDADGVDGSDGGTSASGGRSGETGGASASGGNDSSLPGPNCTKPADLGVRILGRHDGCVAGSIRLSWSGTGFVARFKGTGFRFALSGDAMRYAVIVDGEQQEDLLTGTGEQTYDLVAGLDDNEHSVAIMRQSEASFGTASLRSVEAVGGQLLSPPSAAQRRIEIFGDSVTTGYGNEGEDTSCSFSLDTQNFYLSYGALLARGFGAEVGAVAYSGKGVVSNYDGQGGDTLPELADRAIASLLSSVWDYSLASEPQAVLINLGTNDYSTDNDPSDEEFVHAYVELLTLLRGRYPEAEIFGTVGPLLSDSDLSKARANIASAIAQLSAAGDTKVRAIEIAADNPSPGCDWHPDLATHGAMADELGDILSAALGWEYSSAVEEPMGAAGGMN